jgi:hypothetical protein
VRTKGLNLFSQNESHVSINKHQKKKNQHTSHHPTPNMAERMSLRTSNATKHPALDAAKTTHMRHTHEEVAAERNEKASQKNAAKIQRNSGIRRTAELENVAKAKQKALKNQPGSAITNDPKIRQRRPTDHPEGELRLFTRDSDSYRFNWR